MSVLIVPTSKCESVSVRVSARVCVNFNVEKRARNYRKKHLCHGKIIKSIHTHNLGKALLLALLPAVRGEKPVGTENQFQFVFPADTVGKSAEKSERASERGEN